MQARDTALVTDLYELTMAQAYLAEGMQDTRATFSLFVRKLPPARNYLLAAGLDPVLAWLETLRFTPEDIAYVRSLEMFSESFLAWLAAMRFEGDVRAMLEGTPFFADEPVLEIDAPIAQAQLVETFVMNQIHSQTVLASKASRVVAAAGGRAVVDFGVRRTHGVDGAMKAARAYHIAGITATSHVAAGARYGVPVAGTMAHSFIEAFDDELDAFRAFARVFPNTVLLVDTYDTLEGVRRVVDLARELGDRFRVRGVRLDSGALGELASGARRILDDAGLREVTIFASGGLDEDAIRALVEEARPIDGFGVGTAMGVSEDAPKLDIAYKLVEYGGAGRMKLSEGKRTLPGAKQVWRVESDGAVQHDVIGRRGEAIDGRPLLCTVMIGGRRTEAGGDTLEKARLRAREELSRLPARVRSLDPAEPAYSVRLSSRLDEHVAEVRRRIERRMDLR